VTVSTVTLRIEIDETAPLRRPNRLFLSFDRHQKVRRRTIMYSHPSRWRLCDLKASAINLVRLNAALNKGRFSIAYYHRNQEFFPAGSFLSKSALSFVSQRLLLQIVRSHDHPTLRYLPNAALNYLGELRPKKRIPCRNGPTRLSVAPPYAWL